MNAAKKWGTKRGVSVIDSGKVVQLKDVNNVNRELAKIPDSILLKAKRKGAKLDMVSDSGITAHPDYTHLKGVRPRGWSHGTWDDVPGAGGSKTVVVANKLKEGHGSINLVLHEHAHTIEGRMTSGGSLSGKNSWKVDIWNKNKGRKLIPNHYEASYSEEYWAESFASYFNSAATRNKLPQNVIDYFDDFVKTYK